MYEKKNLSRGTIKRIGLSLCLCGLLLAAILLLEDFCGWGSRKSQRVIEIPNGASTPKVAQILKEEGMVRFPLLFHIYGRLGKAPVFQKGIHYVNGSMGYGALRAKLTSAPDQSAEARRVVIPEGYELRQIISLLVEEGLGERAIFEQEIAHGDFPFSFLSGIPQRENRLEGYLYPDTYLLSPEDSEHTILNAMLANFEDHVVSAYRASETTYSLDEVVTLASIVEREAANDAERPLVASVFLNRLDRGMRLESCATVQYILKERKEVLSLQDIAIDSPYNTYLYSGLPVGPIASPGISSVQAVLFPKETDYLYFVAKEDGSGNLFSHTFDEHNQKTRETQE